MRKLLALVLLAVLGLPSALPLLAATPGDDAGLPACCRRHGRHHCAMSETVTAQSPHTSPDKSTPSLRASEGVCPMRCAPFVQAQRHTLKAVAASQEIFAAVQSHPAVQAQTESRWRVAQERSRGKRGPPAAQRAVEAQAERSSVA